MNSGGSFFRFFAPLVSERGSCRSCTHLCRCASQKKTEAAEIKMGRAATSVRVATRKNLMIRAFQAGHYFNELALHFTRQEKLANSTAAIARTLAEG